MAQVANRMQAMWKTLSALAAAAFFAAAVALSACGDAAGFRPLYGPTASGGNVSEHLKQVDLAPIPGRVGQRIRNEMIFQTTGGGDSPRHAPQPPVSWTRRSLSARSA